MKIIFFGLGSIGKRHARLLLNSFHHELFAYRSSKLKKNQVKGLTELYTWAEVQKLGANIAFITNPTSQHIETAIRCANLGMHTFIEKPLSDTDEHIDQLQSLCRRKNLTCYIAYCLRFHPVIMKMRELIEKKKVYHARVVCTSYLPHWRKGTDHRKNYSASKKMGGGVILDLSHEFDYVEYILGPITKIVSKKGRLADITIDAEDYADVLLTLENDIEVNVHLNFLSRINERTIKIDFKDGYMIGDLVEGTLIYSYKERMIEFNLNISDDELFLSQLTYFFKNLNSSTLMNNLNEARHLLKKIVEIRNG